MAVDLAKAASLCRRSAEQGVADAQTDLGQLYLTGRGIPRDPAEAARWFEKATAQGQANAAMYLGQQYWNGDGVSRDHERAAVLWRKSALAGNQSVPRLLARHYFGTAFIPAQPPAGPKIDVDRARRAAFWGVLASNNDPTSAGRADAEELVKLLFAAVPNLRQETEALIASRQLPPE